MRHSLLAVIAGVLCTTVNAPSALAQGHETPTLTTCIREFYDPGMYNYLTFKNNCSQSLTVVFVAKDGSGTSGSMDLRPGAQDSVGKLGGKVPKIGAFQLYVCPSGSLPVDSEGKAITKPGTTSQCKAKS